MTAPLAAASADPTQRLRQLVAGLSLEQRELLATLLAEAQGAVSPGLPRATGDQRSVGPCDSREPLDRSTPGRPRPGPRGMQFSLFFFSEDSRLERDRYRLLLEAARLADELGFTAIWTPERHFDPFGGSYPNPSLLSAALAMVTRRLRLRAGSVVIPLHHPIRVAEEWSVVDNLSAGRVDIACASGWHLADFVLAPGQYDTRKDTTWQNLDIVQRLWRGEAVSFPGARDQEVAVTIFPKPIQPRLPVWVTATGSRETFRKAGQLGAHVLTHLSAQSVEDLQEHIATYRSALAEHERDPADYCVTVMLHAFVGESDRLVKETVRAPMYQYLRSNLGLHARQARERDATLSISQFTEDDQLAMLEHAFERYYEHRALFGTAATCSRMVERLRGAGVTEVACLVDFGLERRRVLEGVRCLSTLFSSPAELTAVARPS